MQLAPLCAPKQTFAELAECLEQTNDVPAIVSFTKDSKQTWSTHDIGDAAGRLAQGLRDQGIKPGQRVLLLAPASPQFIVATLAVFRVGAVIVPVDIQASDENLAHVFQASRMRLVFTTERIARRLAQLDATPDVPVFLLDLEHAEDQGDLKQEGVSKAENWKSLLAKNSGQPAQPKADDTVVLFYTSGTTGPPKGVPLSHGNILSQVSMIQDSGLLVDGDRLLLPLPLHHVYPVVIGMLAPLALGIPIILPHALVGKEVTRALREGNATIVLGVPRLYSTIFQGIQDRVASSGRLAAGIFALLLAFSRFCGRFGRQPGRKLFKSLHQRVGPDLRMLASGGSPLAPDLARNLEALGWPVAVGYGLTETSPLLTLKTPGEGRHESVGRAVQGVELRVDSSVFPEKESQGEGTGRRISKGEGELLAKGPGVFAGYDDLPEKTAESFADGWFRTGDMARIDADGYVFLQGRVSTMIVLESGENIDPEKIEERYAGCPETAEIGVLEDEGRLAALVVPDKDLVRKHSKQELTAILRKALDQYGSGLPSYQRISRIELTYSPLERTRLGKLKRKQLKEAYQAIKSGKKEQDAPPAGPVSLKDMSSEDRALLEDVRVRKLWDMLARRYKDRPLAPESSIEYDLGVDSLGWVELSLAIEDEVGVSLDEDQFQRITTVHELMETIAGSEEEEAPSRARRSLEQPEQVIPQERLKLAQPRGWLRLCIAIPFYALLVLAMRLFFRVSAKNIEKLPKQGSFVLLPNHVSYLDPFALGVVLGFAKARRCFWAGESGVVARNAVLRTLSRIAQIVPIEREKGPTSSLAFGALVLKRGHPLVWFPEGHRSLDGTLQPFRHGIGLLLGEYDPPVIPVFIQGAEKALPPGKILPKLHKITLHFGKPINVNDLRDAAREGTGDQDRHARMTAILEEKVAQLRDEALGKRKK
ncbi:AMP-binding protein [Desulfonatronum thioautotrophicum]|uniref:AMP-binding protein n=1 Tax=Desulfonatronum thioautotrophicum TaxID=617001 RepID=UPI0006997944|nr:AMP-binding protein [Desulfonatronum thioautotrophicum]